MSVRSQEICFGPLLWEKVRSIPVSFDKLFHLLGKGSFVLKIKRAQVICKFSNPRSFEKILSRIFIFGASGILCDLKYPIWQQYLYCKLLAELSDQSGQKNRPLRKKARP